MLSRVAQSIYWMSRYIERAENTARLINVNTHLLYDLPKQEHLGWGPIIDISSNRELFESLYDVSDETSVVRFMVADTRNPASIISCLTSARDNARTIRDIIPREAWEQINRLYLTAKIDGRLSANQRHRYDYMRTIILGAQTITGLLAGTMTHDACYDLLLIGRDLERADMTTRIIDIRSASLLPGKKGEVLTYENLEWMSVLKSLTAYQMYRRQVRLRINRADVLKFLIQFPQFPRSLSHTLRELAGCVQNLPHNEKPLQQINKLQTVLLRAKPDTLKQEKLHLFMDKIQLGLGAIHRSLDKAYF